MKKKEKYKYRQTDRQTHTHKQQTYTFIIADFICISYLCTITTFCTKNWPFISCNQQCATGALYTNTQIDRHREKEKEREERKRERERERELANEERLYDFVLNMT